MIYAIIALIAEGVFVIVLAIICALVLQASHGLECERDVALHDLGMVRANMKTLQAERDTLKDENADLSEALETTKALYNKILRERNELVARATALQEAMEARPTQPKRAVRKNSTQATEQ